jgi:broad specificity phosphatase PhoE
MEMVLTTQGSSVSRVVLVRHARPVIDAVRPPGEWAMADCADEDVVRLAAGLRSLEVDGVVASPEPKAHGTGQILANELALPLATDDALREQGRDTIPWIEGEGAFRAAVAIHFAHSHDAVFGAESSADAVKRFAGAVQRARSVYQFPVLVTHGRIMCGYIGRVLGRDPMDFWPDLQMPDAFVLDPVAGSCERIGTGK